MQMRLNERPSLQNGERGQRLEPSADCDVAVQRRRPSVTEFYRVFLFAARETNKPTPPGKFALMIFDILILIFYIFIIHHIHN